MFPSAINLGAVFWSHLQLAIEVTALFSPRGLSVCDNFDSLMVFSIFITNTHGCCSETHTAAAFQPPANYIPTTTRQSGTGFMPARHDCQCRVGVSISPAEALQTTPRHSDKYILFVTNV